MPATQKGLHVAMLDTEWVNPRKRPTVEEAEARIHELYDSGKAFFTKKAISDIWEQCQRNPRYGDKITTTDLNGDDVEIEVQTGQIQEFRSQSDVAQQTHLIDLETKELLPPYPTLEPEVVAQHFDKCVQEWKNSQTCTDFQNLLSSFAKGHRINKIVGFALGSMSYLDKGQGEEKSYHRRRSASQHALQLTIRDWVLGRNGDSAGGEIGSIASYVQDPYYTAIDKEVLTKAGLEVIDDPRGWLEVDEQSAVLSIAPNVSVKEIIADLARPAIVIWCRVTEKDYITKEEGSLTDPDSPRVRKMLEGYDIHEFGPDTTLFSDIAVYIRKSPQIMHDSMVDPIVVKVIEVSRDDVPRCPHQGGHSGPSPLVTRLFVQPTSYQPPMASERAIDREERQGLRAIRNFLKARNSYDVLPLSFRLIIFDTSLSVKESLNILIQNGTRIPGDTGIVSAPLWDSKASKFAGLLTTSDYINVIQYYFQNPAALDQIDQFRLNSLREVEKALGVAPPETISIDPERPLYEACRRMLESRARRIPLVTSDSQTERPHVLSVITQYRILKFVAVNVPDTQQLRRPLGELLLGSYDNVATASMDTPVIDVIHILVERSISSVPIVNSEGVVYNVFESVDVITLIKGGVYDDLSLTVGEALKKRSVGFPGIYTCSLNDGLDTIFDTIRKSRVHRLVVVDEHFKLKGVLTLSDILHYILLEGENEEA
ncbi:hypothetical protein PENANT_c007G00930 [Penicillium antarcticum]|uniref:CBS domain-containing protein n=1 Tax=Penicillium antarcticum TaxID=416450 RepID=A0A1V6QBF2_9EURO|nr:hypothetical protein PENANT_c007G00930 [Penicillium antarcticum]